MTMAVIIASPMLARTLADAAEIVSGISTSDAVWARSDAAGSAMTFASTISAPPARTMALRHGGPRGEGSSRTVQGEPTATAAGRKRAEWGKRVGGAVEL